MNKSLTLTRYLVETELGHLVGVYSTREAAERVSGYQPGRTVRESTETYQVGSKVRVHAYGRLRPGIVTGIGRTRVTVRYERNREGLMDSRAFGADEIGLDTSA